MPDAVESSLKQVNWHLLDLDPLNPRLVDPTTGDQPLGQDDAAERLMDDHDPISIGRSMGSFGFFPSDPLIAFEDDGRYVVVEGNRRLLAMRLLLDDGVRAAMGGPQWDALADGLTDALRANLQEVPVQIVVDRSEAAPVIGFRHIVGIKKWDAYEKAAFVRQLVASQVEVEGISDDQVFERVSLLTGEPPLRIRTYLRDYMLLRQAESAGVDVADARAEFGVFTRALSSRGVRTFLQATPPADVTADIEVAYAATDGEVAELLGWIHGDNPVFTDARRLKDLGRVLESPEATEHLRATRNLDEAEGMSGAVRDRILKNGNKAVAALRLVAADIDRVDLDGAVRAVLGQIAAVVAAMPVIAAAEGAGPADGDEDGYDLTTEDDTEDSIESDTVSDSETGYDLTSDDGGAGG